MKKTKFKQTEIGMIPEDWEVIELKDVASYITEKIDLEEIDINNFISTENMLSEKGGIIIASSLPRVGKVTQFKEGDILFSNIRTYFKKLWLSRFSGGCSNDVLVIRKKSTINNRYLYYFLSQDKFFEFTVLTSKGTKMPRGDKNSIMSYEIKLPSLPEQTNIAKILFDLDSKIELNQQMNKTLEAIGQALFKHWFIDFEFPNDNGKPYKSSGGEMIDSEMGKIPKGWNVSIVEKVCSKSTSGGTPSRTNKSYFEGTINWFKTKELLDTYLLKSEESITNEAIDNSSAKLFPKNSIVMAIYAAPTVGRLGILTEDSTFNQAACGFIVDDSIICKEYLFLYLLEERNNLNNLANGAAQQNLSVSKVINYPLIIPPKETMKEFKTIIEPIFDKILFNVKAINTLQNIRDLLLPKLMSGKIRVPVEVK